MNRSFWAGRRVFLTGHTGFKGAWLAMWLSRLGALVTGYALAPDTRPNLFEAGRIASDVNSILGDVRDVDALVGAVRSAQPEIVFHLAAQSLVRRSYRQPVETYATNVMGTVHLLEAVRQTPGVKAVVNVTSDKCYENREWVWGYREDERMGGHDPYSSSKGCAELVTSAWRQSFFSNAGVALGSARAGNVIGGGDWAEDRLVPDIMRAFLEGKPVTIRNPGAVRPWQHVLEPLSGYLLLAERLSEQADGVAAAWNFGPSDDDAREVRWIVERLADRWGSGARWQSVADADAPHEAHLLRLDCAKARRYLGWQPRLSLDTALAWTVDWYRAHGDGRDMRTETENQIARYEELIS